MPRENKHRQVYLWEVEKDNDPEHMRPYGHGLVTFSTPITKPELASLVQKIADENEDKDIYFALRRGGNIWKAYKTDEEENEFKVLFAN